MGVQDRRKREREAREKEILAAAKELFVAKGYEGASIDSIASKLELSKRTIYLYFVSKDELYYAVAKQGLDVMAKMFEQAIDRKGKGLALFANIGIAYADFWDRYPEYRRLINATAFIEPPGTTGPRGKEFEQVSMRIMRAMVGAIEQGIKDGSIREEIDPMMAAMCISSSMQGVLQSLDSNEKKLSAMGIPRSRFIAETLDLFGRALASPGKECSSYLDTLGDEKSKKGGGIR